MKHKTRGFIAMILALCLMMSLGIGALAVDGEQATIPGGESGSNGGTITDKNEDKDETPSTDPEGDGSDDDIDDPATPKGGDAPAPRTNPQSFTVSFGQYDSSVITPTLTYTTDSSSTSTPINYGTQVPAGATISVRVDVTNGYRLTRIYYNDNTANTDVSNNSTISMPGKAISFNFEYAKEYSIEYTASGGTISGKTVAVEGEEVTVAISANTGFEYVADSLKVTQDGGTDVAVINNTFTMPAGDVTITATFKEATEPDPEPAKYTVSANEGQFSITGTGKYEEGDTVNLTITPNTGYYLYSVRIDGEYKEPGAGGYYTFEMPGHDVSVEVVAKPYSDWRDWHNIDTYSNSVDGGISVVSGALEGSTVTFRVWSNFKYDYNYDYRVYVTNDRTGATVKCDYSSYYDEYSFTMPDDDVTISVYFDHVGDYTITKDVEGDGSIYVQSSADYDEKVWITAKPGSGQSLTSLRVFREDYGWYQTSDGKWHGYGKSEVDVEYSEYYDAYYFYMPADDVVVYARFTDGATVTVTSGDHGSAKVSSRYAEKGDWVYITAYPDDGYEVADVTVVDRLGKSVKVTELSSDYFLFTMPGTSVDVKVTFREVDYGYFYDVSRGDWYYEAVRYVYEKGIMEGTSAHYFSPNADLSRGMLATILYRLEGSPNVSSYSSFNDVADTSYYAKAIAWAERNGIVNGVTTERFEPDTAVTREQMAAILCRYADYKGHDTSVSYDYLATFGDSGSSHVYARPALNWAVAHRIINGQGSSVLAPRATATRAEVAQVLMNYLEAYD